MKPETNKALERLQNLKNKREQLLAMPGDTALEFLAAEEQAVAIVHSLPPQDLHLLIGDIGAEEALPLLALASNRQWEYLLDIEVWQKDRIDFAAASKWLKQLLLADPGRLAEWCAKEKDTFIDFFLLYNIEVKIREFDETPSEMGNDFTSFDDTFYFRILDPPVVPDVGEPPHDPVQSDQYLKDRRDFLMQLLKHLSDFDHRRFQDILLESGAIIPAETEEEMYRLRNVRLAEKGFLPFEEAVSIYQPLTSKTIQKRTLKLQTDAATKNNFMPVPYVAQTLLTPDDIFAQALSSVKNEMVMRQLQSEFAGLCNQLLIADQKTIKGRSGLSEAVKKASGFIGMGLESLSGNKTEHLEQYLLADIFRIGYGAVLDLKWQAEQWRDASWFMAQGLPLSFWGEEWLGVIGGLLIKKPLFFDKHQTDDLYREFSTIDDMTATHSILGEIIAFDGLLAALSLKVKPYPATGLLTYKNLLLTHWAKDTINESTGETELSPLPLDAFKTFFDTLWRSAKKPRAIKLTMKSAFLKWLTDKSGLTGMEISEQCGNTFETLFAEIETELGQVSAKNLDPRFIQLFLVS
jgi:Family of unknown function (DUF6178)